MLPWTSDWLLINYGFAHEHRCQVLVATLSVFNGLGWTMVRQEFLRRLSSRGSRSRPFQAIGGGARRFPGGLVAGPDTTR